ncbi:MAG: hypothetical protein JKY81_01780 [Colwellia sp.]|nr:hypothetical protein [Colwellia sp.]
MPTIQAREYYSQQVHYLRKSIGFADDGVELTMGVIPSGSVILKALSGINVDVAFDAGTTNTVNMGTSADDNLYGTVLAAGAIAFVPLDETVAMTVAADTTMTVTVVLTGTAATVGNGEALIAYIPDNDG